MTCTNSGPEALRQLELLVMRAPPQLRFVLAARHDVRLGLHRLRLEGELAEIRADDLRFTVEEAGQLRALALISLGITEYVTASPWDDAARHLESGIALARRTGRPYLEFTGLAHLTPIMNQTRSLTRGGEVGREAVALAERHGWTDDPAFGTVSNSLASTRVHGVSGLRVADASVMPSIVSGNTNATVYAIAERAAELIRLATR